MLLLFSTFGTPTEHGDELSERRTYRKCSSPRSESNGQTPNTSRGRCRFVPTSEPAPGQARYLLKNPPHSKIAVLYQNDDFGKGYLKPLQGGTGEATRHDSGRRGLLRDKRHHGRFSDHRPEEFRCRHAIQFRFAEVRGPVDPQGPRDRLEASPSSRHAWLLGHCGAATGWIRETRLV